MRIGFDFDGVLCNTPFGRFAVHAPDDVPELPRGYEALYEAPRPSGLLRLLLEHVRFAWRPAVAGAPEIVRELARRHELYVVTGRSVAGEPLLRDWLRGHGLDGAFAGIRMSPPGLRSAQHKLAAARMLALDAHIDDDPRTAYHLAHNGLARVFLFDHANARGDVPPPPGVTVVASLRAFADALG